MEKSPKRSRKDEAWLTCAPKSCCYAGVIVPTGVDVWRIARTLEAPPLSFLMYFESRTWRRDAFALDKSHRRFRIALAKRPPAAEGEPSPCTFLIRTRGDHHRCGLGELRPGVCRCFPCDTASGMLCIDGDTDCTCRRWSLADVDIDDEMPRVEARQRDAELYCAVVARWNQHVSASDESVDFAAYCAWLLDAYDELLATGGREERSA